MQIPVDYVWLDSNKKFRWKTRILKSAVSVEDIPEWTVKDLILSQIAAESVDADTPMGDLAMKLYKTFVEKEDGAGKDFSAMLPRFEKKSRN